MNIMGGKSKLVLVFAVLAALFVAACSTADGTRSNARGVNDPDTFGDAQDNGLGSTGIGAKDGSNGTNKSMYGQQTAANASDNRSMVRGNSANAGQTSSTTGMDTTTTRSNARTSGDTVTPANGYADDNLERVNGGGLTARATGVTSADVNTQTTRSNARADTQELATMYMGDLGLGSEWRLVRTMHLDTNPEATVYVYEKMDVSGTQSVTYHTAASNIADENVPAEVNGRTVPADAVADSRSNARTTSTSSTGVTQILLVGDVDNRASARGTATTVDDNADMLYVVVQGNEVAGAVTVDADQAAVMRSNARSTYDDTTVTVGTGSAPWSRYYNGGVTSTNDDDTRSNARASSDDDEDDMNTMDDDTSSSSSPWNTYR